MLTSTANNQQNNCKHSNDNSSNGKTRSLNRVSSSTSSSSSSLSSFPSDSSLCPKPKTMEEVWNDINLASLNDHPSADQDFSVITPTPYHHHHHHHHRNHHHPRHHPSHNNHPQNNFVLQDFLAKPFTKDPPTTITAPISTTSTSSTMVYSSPSAPHPPTVLSLNSASGLDFLNASDALLRSCPHLQTNPISDIASFTSPLEALASSSSLPLFGKKRVQESDDSNSGDRRHKRMIKNRESAARSRARKQAYTTELELEVAQLTEENARLKRQQEELCSAAAAQLPRKYALHRSLTAPF